MNQTYLNDFLGKKKYNKKMELTTKAEPILAEFKGLDPGLRDAPPLF